MTQRTAPKINCTLCELPAPAAERTRFAGLVLRGTLAPVSLFVAVVLSGICFTAALWNSPYRLIAAAAFSAVLLIACPAFAFNAVARVKAELALLRSELRADLKRLR